MGCVLRGHDPELGRELAVKVILPAHRDSPDLVRRFLAEARLAGQLQHPGVVPVHDVGRLDDGRPFFAMKLIEGCTLAQLLRGRPDPGQDLPRFLRYFEAVCQAVGYAHSRGVIHRDLKPGNVMVGSFGEVQVMDWGLAKRLAPPSPGEARSASEGTAKPEAPARGPQARSGSEATPAWSAGDEFAPGEQETPVEGAEEARTRRGVVLGTPACLAPEQASGEGERLDERSDVFGLGAMLCEILTGKPPYVSKDSVQVHRKAACADLAEAHARLEGCGADAELVGLALACLAPRPADRPRDAKAVAEALATYLDGVQARLRKAELAQAEARARAAEEAKRRRLALSLAGTVLLAVSAGSAAALWLQADRQARQTQLTREVNDALDQVTALREKATAATADSAGLSAQAREQAQRALTLVRSGPVDEALKLRVRRVWGELGEEEKDRQFLAALEAARLDQAEPAGLSSPGGVFQVRFFRGRVPRFREAFRAFGLPAAAAERLRQRPRQVREAVSAALDEWLDLAASPQLRIREPHLDWLRALADAGPDEGGLRELRAASQEKDPGKRRATLEKLAAAADVRKLPPHTLTRLASRLVAAQSWTSAVQLLRRARQQHPGDFWVNLDLGLWLIARPSGKKGTGPWEEAQLPYSAGAVGTPQRWAEAVRCLTAAAALRPNSPLVHFNLGNALGREGQFDEALACFERAIAIDPKFVPAHFNLGVARKAKGQVDEAIACYKKALALDPKHAKAHTNLGTALKSKGDLEGAIACYKKAIALDPKDAHPHYNLGNTLRDMEDVGGAIACFRKAIALDPNSAPAHNNLGNALKARGTWLGPPNASRRPSRWTPSMPRPTTTWAPP
jgi:serine/threonine-protein kinase